MADTPENAPKPAPDNPNDQSAGELPVARWDRPSRWDESRFADPPDDEGLDG